MTTETIEKPDTKADDGSGTDDHLEVFHYVNKNAMVESAIEGKMVVALCGEVFPVRKVAKPGSPVCADCKRVYDRLPK